MDFIPSSKIVDYLLRGKFAFWPFPVTSLSSSTPRPSPDLRAAVDAEKARLEKLPYLALQAEYETARAVVRQRAIEEANAREAKLSFNLPSANADFSYWVKADFWTLEETVALLLGRRPEVANWKSVAPCTLISEFARQYEQLRNLALRAELLNRGSKPIRPAVALQWAQEIGVPVPQALLTAMEVRQQSTALQPAATRRAMGSAPGNAPLEIQNAHVVQGLQRLRGWYDESLAASHWFSLRDVAPRDAAMLLCEFNPHTREYEDAARTTNTDTEPRDLIQLEQRFVDLSKAEPRARTLVNWLIAARHWRVKYSPWIDRYVEAVPELSGASAEPLPDVGEPQPAPASAKHTTTNDVAAAPTAANRRGWRDVAFSYVVETYKAGQYATAKDLFKALERSAATGESPFEKGIGQHAGSLFVREIGKPLALKTIENAWREIRTSR